MENIQLTRFGAPPRCYGAPDEIGLEWTWSDGQLTVTIAGSGFHNVLVIEK